MDLATLTPDSKLEGWEGFIVPPLENCLLTGDILREAGASWDNHDAHRVVLSPSCDLVMRLGKTRVAKVLLAKCCGIEKYEQGTKAERLSSFLNEAHRDGYVALHEYPSVVPHMAACLRDLELIPITDVAVNQGEAGKFVRTASIDSPFREQLAWAYLQVSGRPGVPVRNVDSWAEAIKQKAGKTTKTKN